MRRLAGNVAVTLVATLVAGCAGRANTTGFVPLSAGIASYIPSDRQQTFGALVYLRIPARHHARPHYVSPATASLTVAVRPLGLPALPIQKFVVATPRPCKSIAGSGGALQCAFVVRVLPGRDAFSIATYAHRAPTGSTLSEYVTPSAVPMPPPGSALAFTLEGVVDHVVMEYGQSIATTDAARQIAAFPVAAATSVPLSVTPYDTANYRILTQVGPRGSPVPYFAPFKLDVSPSRGGVTMQNDRGLGASVTIANPDDLSVTVRYDGKVVFRHGIIASDSFSIGFRGATASLSPARPSPTNNTAGVALASNVIERPLGSFTGLKPAALVAIPRSSSMLYLLNSSIAKQQSSIFGVVARNGSATKTKLGFTPSSVFADSFGEYWMWDARNATIYCFNSSVSNIPAGSVVPAESLSVNNFGGFAQDADDNLWFALDGVNGSSQSYGEVGYIRLGTAASCTSPSVQAVSGNVSNFTLDITSIAAIPNGDGAYIGGATTVASGAPPPQGFFIATAPAAEGSPTVNSVIIPSGAHLTALASSSTAAYGLTTNSSTNSVVELQNPGNLLPLATFPSGLADIFSGSLGSALSARDVLATSAFSSTYNGTYVGLVDTTDSDPSLDWEALAPSSNACTGAAFDKDGMLWTLCQSNTSPSAMSFYRLLPTSTWSVLPATTIPVSLNGTSGSYFLSILENIGATSGPFSLKRFSSLIVSASAVGDRGVAIAFRAPSSGTYTATADIVDAHGRRVPVTFRITASAGRPGILPQNP